MKSVRTVNVKRLEADDLTNSVEVTANNDDGTEVIGQASNSLEVRYSTTRGEAPQLLQALAVTIEPRPRLQS